MLLQACMRPTIPIEVIMFVRRPGQLLSRRRVLASRGAIAVAFAIGRQRPYAADSLFTLGVASGEPSSDGFVIWTRLAVNPLAPDGAGGMSAPLSVFWEVAADGAPISHAAAVRRPAVDAGLRRAGQLHGTA